MLGFSHAAMGALGWFIVAEPVSKIVAPLIGQQPLNLAELGVGAIACAGAAIMPDLDHPQATIAHTFGPVSYFASKLTHLLAGGHRQGTHSILFSVGFGALCYLVGTSTQWFHSAWPAMILMFLLTSFAFRALNIVPPRTSGGIKGIVVIAEAIAVTFAIQFFMPNAWWFLGLAGFIGCIIHLIGDSLTPEGVPWFYPARWRLAIPIISHTGNILEKAIISPLLVIGVLYEIFITYIAKIFGL